MENARAHLDGAHRPAPEVPDALRRDPDDVLEVVTLGQPRVVGRDAPEDTRLRHRVEAPERCQALPVSPDLVLDPVDHLIEVGLASSATIRTAPRRLPPTRCRPRRGCAAPPSRGAVRACRTASACCSVPISATWINDVVEPVDQLPPRGVPGTCASDVVLTKRERAGLTVIRASREGSRHVITAPLSAPHRSRHHAARGG